MTEQWNMRRARKAYRVYRLVRGFTEKTWSGGWSFREWSRATLPKLDPKPVVHGKLAHILRRAP